MSVPSIVVIVALCAAALWAAHQIERRGSSAPLWRRTSSDPLKIDEVQGRPSGHDLGEKLNQDPDVLRMRQLRDEAIAAQMPEILRARTRLEKRAEARRVREATKVAANGCRRRRPARIVRMRQEEKEAER